MSALRSAVMAFACFSSIPMPRVEWDDKNMRYMMAAFPLVGVVIGLCVLLWHRACATLGCGQLLWGAGLALIPLAVTGGIHMDGFADVTDALSSHAQPARKRAILKDPHVGAFAVMGVSCYLIAYFALACELDVRYVPVVAGVPVVSRCLSGLATVRAKTASKKGMLANISDTARTRAVSIALAVELALSGVILVALDPLAGSAALVVALLALVWTLRLATREFGGMSGDLSGYYVQLAEISMLACVVLVGKLV